MDWRRLTPLLCPVLWALSLGWSLALAQTAGAAVSDDAVELAGEMVTGAAFEEDSEQTPGSITVIRSDEVKGEQLSLPDLLERVPGLHVVQSRGRGAYSVASIRGSTSSQVVVYVDGVRQNLRSEAAVDLSAIPVAEIDRVEVYRGYIPARFSEAGLGGIINIITRKAADEGERTNVTLGASSYGGFNGGVSHSRPLWGGNFFAAVDYERSQGDFSYRNDNSTPYNNADDYDATRDYNGYGITSSLLKWDDEHWSARMMWTRNDRELPNPAPGMDKAGSKRGASLDTDKWEFSLARRQKAGAVDWGWRAEYLYQEKIWDNPDNTLGGLEEYHNEYDSKRLSLAADASWAWGERHFFELAASYASETLDVKGDIVGNLGGLSHFSQDAWDAVLQDSISLTRDGTLLLSPSLRWNCVDGDDHLTWALALTKQAGPWTFKGTYGTYSRAPNLYERYGDGATVRPNRSLAWETGTQWDLGVAWSSQVADGSELNARVALTYFGRDTDDMIEYVMTSPRFGIYENLGEAQVNGIELEAELEWRLWKLSFSGTWMDARNETGGNYRRGRRLPNAPEWAYTARLSRFFRDRDGDIRWSAFIEGQFTGSNYFDQNEQVLYDDLFLLNAGVKWQLGRDASLAFGVYDLLDNGPDIKLVTTTNGPTRTAWYPLQGRSFYLTLNWTF